VRRPLSILCLLSAHACAQSTRLPLPPAAPPQPPSQVPAARINCADGGAAYRAPTPPALTPLPCDCETPGTPGAPVSTRRPESYPTHTVRRDPRPVVLIACMNGNRTGPRLWAPWWNQPDGEVAVHNLIVRLENCYSRGFRRMVLYMPGGQETTDPEGAVFSSAQYWSLPSAHKRALQTRLRAWIARKAANADPVTLGVYGGFHVNADVNCLSMHPSHAPDVSNLADVQKTFQNVSPWMELGFSEYWLDYSATKPCIPGAFQSHPDFVLPGARGHTRFGGEAIPYVKKQIVQGGRAAWAYQTNPLGQHVPDAQYLAQSPWVCALSFVRSAFPAKNAWGFEPDVWRIADPSGALTPARTELGLMFVDGAAPQAYTATIDDAVRLFRADSAARAWSGPWNDGVGWVLWAGHEDIARSEYPAFHRYIEMVQRVYDMGTIRAAADYNADGAVNDTDNSMAGEAIKANLNATAATYLMGDFDQDGSVTTADLPRFREWWEKAVLHKEYVPTDLKSAGP